MNDKEILETNKHIPDTEVIMDITDTEKEINEFKAKKILRPKLSTTYDNEIEKRKKFIEKLRYLLKLRGEQK